MLNDKVIKTSVERIITDGGDVIKNIKVGDKGYLGFGETYYSKINFAKKKGWKKHLKMTLNLTCVIGKVKFIFSENLKEFESIVLSEENLYRITIYPNVWFAFEGLYKPFSVINNVADIVHDPNEVERKNIDEVDLKW